MSTMPFRTPRLAKPLRLVAGEGYVESSAKEATHLELNMPGPMPYRVLPVIQKGTREGTGCWTWNGSVEAPTLKPSILTTDHQHRCHSWVNDGNVQFLEDSNHDLAGKTVELLPVDCDNCVYCGELIEGLALERGDDICGQCKADVGEDQPTGGQGE
jgi:hypothetical protein